MIRTLLRIPIPRTWIAISRRRAETAPREGEYATSVRRTVHSGPQDGARVLLRSPRGLMSSVIVVAFLVAISLFVARWVGIAVAQGEPAIGIDARPEANGPTSLGTADSCVSVASGESLDVDITIVDATELLAWEAYFKYEPRALRVTGVDVEMFQAANANSNVFDASDPLPDRDGLYRLTAADLGEPDAADSGSGVLARLTLEALLPGIHAISVDAIDLDEDGKPDIGPTLTDDSGDHPGDSDRDGFFDGAISNAEVAVDRNCADGGSAGAIPESASGVGGSGTPWWMAAPIGAGVAAALVIGGFVARAMLRRRPSQA